MDDDKDQATTSRKESNLKKEGKPTTSKKESRNDFEDCSQDEDRSSYSASRTHSAASQVVVSEARQEAKIPQTCKPRIARKKKPVRRNGRIMKRRRSGARRAVTRRAPIRRYVRPKVLRKEPGSLCTIFTARSSHSSAETQGCQYCGHRCCRSRCTGRGNSKDKAKKCSRCKKIIEKKYKCNEKIKTLSVAIQMGSRSKMLSHLYVDSSSSPVEEQFKKSFCDVTPQMLHDSVLYLSKWTEAVKTESIVRYMTSHYPVNPDENQFINELFEKLTVAVAIGTLTRYAEDTWMIPIQLRGRNLSTTHVTDFWKLYGNTMKPIERRNVIIHNTPSRAQGNLEAKNDNPDYIA